ncbi:class F sortase [Kineococcus rubinsiae]|uniref:class F sortase n=1 Tax=Kineococcus rubinsiae TaxID=2609562 RepID=UPI001AD8A336|nr:class F sortase [Kineococcus rubinsiae]NIZ89999.1 class F sortase [Kineococcus rubinsiae]
MSLVLALTGVALLLSWWSARPAADVGVVAAPAATTAPAVVALPAAPAGVAVPLVGTRSAAVPPVAVVLPPVSLDLPDRRISAPVLPVGVDPDGLLEVPRDGDDVGWYRWSAVPGEPGTAVFAGHVDTLRDGPGAFYDLSRAEPGNLVAVTLEDGSVREFSVTARESFPKTSLPVDTVFRRGGTPQLVLVTCSGPFDEDTRSYEENLVVTAEPRG